MHHIDVIISETGTFVGKTIRFFTKSKYNHASFAIDEDFTKLYSFGRKRASSPLNAGFVIEKASYFSLGREKDIAVKIFRIPITKNKLKKLKQKLELISYDNEYIYDLFSVILYPFSLSGPTYKAYYCSEFISYVLKKYTSIILTKPYYKYSPKDLNKLLTKHLWYEGNISTFADIKLNEEDPFFEKVSIKNKLGNSISLILLLLIRKIRY